MSATALIFNAPVSQGAVTGGQFAMTPLILATHAAADSFTFYLGGIPTAQLSGMQMIVENAAGTVVGAVPLTPNADGTSAVYTAAGTESWLATAGQTFNVYVVAQLTSDPNLPPAAGVTVQSKKVSFTTV